MFKPITKEAFALINEARPFTQNSPLFIGQLGDTVLVEARINVIEIPDFVVARVFKTQSVPIDLMIDSVNDVFHDEVLYFVSHSANASDVFALARQIKEEAK